MTTAKWHFSHFQHLSAKTPIFIFSRKFAPRNGLVTIRDMYFGIKWAGEHEYEAFWPQIYFLRGENAKKPRQKSIFFKEHHEGVRESEK